MTIRKYLHSCICIEENGKRLLIDPGNFSFAEGFLKPEDIGPVDVIVYTHSHPDHYYPEALKVLLALNGATIIIANHEIGALLKHEGTQSHLMSAGERCEVAGFTIEAFAAPHGPVPVEPPLNLAYRINNTVLHPGDSFAVSGVSDCPVLALPMMSPWGRLVDALAFVDRLKPNSIVPIHDAFVKDFMLRPMYERNALRFKNLGIDFHPLGLTDALSLDQ